MGFAGNLRTLALPEVLQTINRIKATGVLRLASAEGGRDVIFNEGEVIGLAFRRGEERQAILRRLILDGRLEATEAAQISSSGRESQVLARLIEQGAIDQATVSDSLQRQTEDELQSLFTWDYADFVFHDAGPEQEDITELVERAKADGLQFNLNSVLMESARRQDEWERVRQAIPDGGLVLGPREGMEAQIQQAAAEYPASAIVGLVDAVRSVDDIVRDSVATRLDTYATLAALMERGLVVPLTRDDIIYHGDYLQSKNDLLRAGSLFRRALAARPSDQDTARKLAECLAKLGDAPEAAACYAQLALGCLNAQDFSAGLAHARKAVQLAPKDPALRQTLVRCLLAHDQKHNHAEAVGELLQLIELFQGLDRYEDARSTCLKVLELDKGNEPARRQLARIFSAAAQEAQAEDVVICIQCGHVNHREAAECEKCKASLQLSCLACGRVVGVSDRLCIFCGADPHRGSSGRRAGGSPATSRIVNPDKVRVGAVAGGAQAVRDQLDSLVASARAKEEAEDWDGALTAWREVAKIQVDNAELTAHIRRIETLVHDTFVESQIEKGHQYRRVRRYWAAIGCYKAALRTMPSDDPRAQRLVEILAATQKVGSRIALVYVAAIVLIAVVGVLIARPIIKERGFRSDIEAIAAKLAPLNDAPDGAQLAPIQGEITEMRARIDELGEAPRWAGLRRRIDEITGDFTIAWQRAQVRDLAQTGTAIDQGDLKRADELMEAFNVRYQVRSPRVLEVEARIKNEKRKRDELNSRIKEAPTRLAAAEATEAAGHLGAALKEFRDIAESPNVEVAAKAREAVGRLGPKAAAANAAIDEVLRGTDAAIAVDAVKADAALAGIAEQAVVWGQGERVQKLREAIAQQLADAKAEAARLGPDSPIEALAEFIRKHPGAPEAAGVKSRYDARVRALAAKAQAIDRWRQLMQDKQWEPAWTAGRELVASFGATPADQIKLPLVVETTPAGAMVLLDGKEVGPSPAVVLYAPGQKGEVAVDAAGCQRLSRRLEDVATAWRWAPSLARATVWRAELGKTVAAIQPTPSGEAMVVTSDGLALLGAKGQVRWRVATAGDDLAAGRKGEAQAPTLLPDGRCAASLTGSGMVVLDGRGGAVRHQTTAEVRGRPLSYVNEVLGATPRLAFAAESIWSGDPSGPSLTRIPLPAPAISGPVAVAKDIDRILVVADTRGKLVGIEESAKRVIWDADVQAADVGQLVPVGDTDVVTVLDGVRLACYGLGPAGATLRWTHQLEASAIGDPVLANGVIHIASGQQIIRLSAEGTVLPGIPLPGPASCPVAAFGDRAAIGCADGAIRVFRAGVLQWSSPVGAVPSAVAIGKDSVLAGLPSGAVYAFAP